tara:strand:- start:496 stop:609 length:114 start_codon:yes stop_codon:yes gene_type:complete
VVVELLKVELLEVLEIHPPYLPLKDLAEDKEQIIPLT